MIRKTRSHLALLFAVTLVTVSLGSALVHAASDEAIDSDVYRISSVHWEKGTDEYLLRVKGNSEPTFTPYELFEPLRIVLDIADGEVAAAAGFPLQPDGGPVVSVNAEVLDDQEPSITRMEILLADDSSYSVEKQENDILVRFASSADEKKSTSGESQAASALLASLENSNQENADNPPAKLETSKTNLQDDFSFSGYGKEKISIDFFKIDLHNVFRLIGEVSGQNIVVDEAVKGSLTLALEDVPWDFVLDVVVNLKDLQKMERFNTILILPRDKEIDWPEQSTGRLAFEAEESLTVDDKEGITVQERLAVAPEEVQAKKLVRLANESLMNGDYNSAFALLENAFAIWPEDGRLASKIASLCLVHLGLNAKGIHYAKQALRLDPDDSNAALQAAIGYAKMQNSEEAIKYFAEATRGERPAASALLSYAAFSEQNGDNEGALALIDIHREVHGDNIDTMVSKARLFEKMGEVEKAIAQYRSIQLSGYQLPADLKRYIEGRISITQ